MNFIPPYRPHINGQIERNVKSFKHHFRRTFNYERKLTYEQAQTLMIEIEGILNSKPLCALSEVPTSFAYLSPAHLSIFRPIKPFPEAPVESKNPVHYYDILKKLSEQFWDFFKTEMFAQSQKRVLTQLAKTKLFRNDFH